MKISGKHRTLSDHTVLFLILTVLTYSCKLFLDPGFTTGTIIGLIELPEGSASTISEIYLYLEEKPGFIKKAVVGETFTIEGLEDQAIYTLYATSEPMGVIRNSSKALSKTSFAARLENITAVAGAGTELGSVLLRQTGIIKGQILLHARDEFVGIDVYIPGTSFGAKTDSEGSFTIYYVPQGMYRLRVEKAMWQGKWIDDVLVEGNDNGTSQPVTELDSVVTLYKGYGTIQGSIYLAGGLAKPVGAIILLKNRADEEAVYTITTDTAGAFSVSYLAPGIYDATISYPEFIAQIVGNITLSAAETVQIEAVKLIANGGVISGLSTLSEEMSHEGIQVLAEHIDGVPVYNTLTNTNGTFVFENCLLGEYTITSSRSGYESSRIANAVVVAGETTTVNIPALIISSGTITGRVILEGVSDYANVAIHVERVADTSIRYTTLSKKDGTYIVNGVGYGQYVISFHKDEFFSNTVKIIQVELGGTSRIDDVELESALCIVEGIFQLKEAIDHSGISLLLKSTEEDGQSYFGSSDADGEYSFSKVLAGSYTVSGSKSGYESKSSGQFTLSQGVKRSLDTLELQISFRSVIGSVKLEGKTDHAGVMIAATNLAQDKLVYSAISNSVGDYALAGMQPGEYRIILSSAGYRTQTLPSIDLTLGESITIEETQMTIARGIIAGLVTLEGWLNYSGTTVELLGTTYITNTDEKGAYSFSVPSGNYPGGVRFSKQDFKTTSDTETITVLTDSTYAVSEHELKATHTTITGTLDLLGTSDDSGISVSLDGITGFSTTTANDGDYILHHVPLGTYTLRFVRLNTPTVTINVSVIPSPEVKVSELRMIPNSSSLEGYIKLTDMTDHSGIDVSITTENEPTLSTVTNSSGYFYIGNFLSTGTHSITASKTGWDSTSFSIDDFEPLEIREVGVSHEINLIDTTAPLISEVIINGGANMSDEKNIEIRITAIENGSGIERMKVSFDGMFDVEPWEPYRQSFSREIPIDGNGERSVTIKLRDTSLNESTANSDTIIITNQFKTFSGVLSDEDLHWQKEDGVIMVTGNILVEIGKSLIIDPGVEVRVNPGSYIKIEGKIQAIGSENDRIFFRSTENGNSFGGIQFSRYSASFSTSNYLYVDGSIFKYCIFTDSGTLTNSPGQSYPGFYVSHCIFNEGSGLSIGMHQSIIRDSVFEIRPHIDRGLAINNLLDNGVSCYSGRFVGNTIRNGAITISSGPSFSYNDIRELTSSLNLRYSSSFNHNNIINIWSDDNFTAKSTNSRNQYLSYNMQYNFWGYDKTIELDSIGMNGNASFFYDYYDDFNQTEIDYANYFHDPIPSVGYDEKGFVEFDFSIDNGSAESVDTNVNIDIDLRTKDESAGAKIRVAQSINALLESFWTSYNDAFIFTFDEDLVEDGWVTIFLQIQDERGVESPIISKEIAYN